MKFEIKHRFSGAVVFTAEIEATDDTPFAMRLGLAVKKAVEVSANLRYADLSYADLSSANLRYADLSYADLRYADLRYADLSYANLRYADLNTFKADFWMILTKNRAEVSGLISALKDGRVNGSTYHGACACLVGTIANVRGVSVDDLEQDSDRPAERWFMMIREGDKPGDDSGGGFASKMALEWAEEWLSFTSPSPVAVAA